MYPEEGKHLGRQNRDQKLRQNRDEREIHFSRVATHLQPKSKKINFGTNNVITLPAVLVKAAK